MSVIAAVRGELPPNRYTQAEVTEALLAIPGYAQYAEAIRKLHAERQGEQPPHGAAAGGLRRARRLRRGQRRLHRARRRTRVRRAAGALDDAGLRPVRRRRHLHDDRHRAGGADAWTPASPGRIGLRPDVRRVPMFGLGCVAGAAGVARLHDYLRGAPDDVAVLVAVELCSLVPKSDPSMATVVGSSLFGDGAAAVVAVGDRRAAEIGACGPEVLDSRSHLYPDSQRTMGWDVDSDWLPAGALTRRAQGRRTLSGRRRHELPCRP